MFIVFTALTVFGIACVVGFMTVPREANTRYVFARMMVCSALSQIAAIVVFCNQTSSLAPLWQGALIYILGVEIGGFCIAFAIELFKDRKAENNDGR